VYGFTNGVINTTPNSGLSNALTTNHALFLPEPRVGFAWNVFGNGRTSLTGGAGLHHTLLDALDYRLDQAAPYNTVYSYSSSTVANPTGVTPAVSPSTVDPAIRTPTLLSYDLKIEQQIAPATSLTIGYTGSHSYHQIMNGDLNEPAYTIAASGQVFYPASGTTSSPAAPIKANPAVANTTSWWAGGSGNYNALVVDLRHSITHGFQLRGNYTWSKNLDDGSAWNTSVSSNTPAFVEVPLLPHLDYGPAATDIRNVASINATYELPFGKNKAFFGNAGELTDHIVSGWSLASITTLLSGFPFSPQLGYNPTGSGDSRNPERDAWIRGAALSRRQHRSAGRAILQSRSVLRPGRGLCRQCRPRFPGRSWFCGLGPLAAEVNRTQRARPPSVPRGVLQHHQPHQPATAERGRVLRGPDAGHRREPEHGRRARFAWHHLGHGQHQPADSARIEAAVLSCSLRQIGAERDLRFH
jgi:hypothetical protein